MPDSAQTDPADGRTRHYRTIGGRQVLFDGEGFLWQADEWREDVAETLARECGLVVLADEHWQVIRFLREDYAKEGETATLRRISVVGGVPTKTLFQLFPQKPAKKLAYVAGLPKPHGCV